MLGARSRLSEYSKFQVSDDLMSLVSRLRAGIFRDKKLRFASIHLAQTA